MCVIRRRRRIESKNSVRIILPANAFGQLTRRSPIFDCINKSSIDSQNKYTKLLFSDQFPVRTDERAHWAEQPICQITMRSKWKRDQLGSRECVCAKLCDVWRREAYLYWISIFIRRNGPKERIAKFIFSAHRQGKTPKTNWRSWSKYSGVLCASNALRPSRPRDARQ